MCELFAMSSRRPANVQLSVAELARHGGLVGPHRDGWGLAYYEGRDLRLFKEAAPAATSASLGFLQEHPFSATTVISHIRKATQGDRTLEDAQPFVRELGGHQHVFAHNGDLTAFADPRGRRHAMFRSVGDTDSERAFCALLERLRAPWDEAEGVPPLETRLRVIAGFAATLREHGPANFLYSDGDAIFVHAHRRGGAGGRAGRQRPAHGRGLAAARRGRGRGAVVGPAHRPRRRRRRARLHPHMRGRLVIKAGAGDRRPGTTPGTRRGAA
jgi:glutamine amidotransferase